MFSFWCKRHREKETTSLTLLVFALGTMLPLPLLFKATLRQYHFVFKSFKKSRRLWQKKTYNVSWNIYWMFYPFAWKNESTDLIPIILYHFVFYILLLSLHIKTFIISVIMHEKVYYFLQVKKSHIILTLLNWIVLIDFAYEHIAAVKSPKKEWFYPILPGMFSSVFVIGTIGLLY